MNEGWHGDNYLILFSDTESAEALGRYGIATQLPGYRILGLRSWDDFILCDSAGQTHTVPTVPAIPGYLAPYKVPSEPRLKPDKRCTGKVKWYVKPLIVGGDPDSAENLTWISHEEHEKLVTWWNDLYFRLTPSPTP